MTKEQLLQAVSDELLARSHAWSNKDSLYSGKIHAIAHALEWAIDPENNSAPEEVAASIARLEDQDKIDCYPRYVFVLHSRSPNAKVHASDRVTGKPICGAHLSWDAVEHEHEFPAGWDRCQRCPWRPNDG